MACIQQNFALFFLLSCSLQFISAQNSETFIDWVSEESTAQHSWQLKPRQDSRSCEAWRFGVEANNVRNWKKIPSECVEYIENYMMGSQYALDSSIVANESIAYASSLNLSNNAKDAWVFDVDETLLSNLPYYQSVQFGGPNDHGTSAVVYKSDRRLRIEQAGFQIRGNSGDQWSDLIGYSGGDRTFKLPNPMYYVA